MKSIMSERHRAEPAENIENRLRGLRTSKGLSQGELARMAGITRQAVYAIEANRYLPTTAVALRLASVLGCRVEDVFSLIATGEVVRGRFIRSFAGVDGGGQTERVKVVKVGRHFVARPVSELGEVLNYTVPADGLILAEPHGARQILAGQASVRVRLIRDRRAVEREIALAGCDPTVFLAGEHLRHRDEQASVVGWTMGSAAALEALKRNDVHAAGLHLIDERTGECNLPYIRRHLKGRAVTVVTFASWEQGWLVKGGNPKHIRRVEDLARKTVSLINREPGSGARVLLDRKLAEAGIAPNTVKGYARLAASHLEVGRNVAAGFADAGIGLRSVARLFGLTFLPLQEERYDLVIPTDHLKQHQGLSALLDTIVSRPFRTEIEALGGYDTSETGKVWSV
jgi:molybdate-binding protein/DNA-binding XRE family transcriptional regulator